jgi:acyl-CoA synthetase (AMP-forming)/AMP-acid ligase II
MTQTDLKIFDREVEESLFSHPKIKKTAVIDVSHERWGEIIKPVVVKESRVELREDEVIEFCKQQMESYKRPTSMVFFEPIPKTETGGVAKWKLREKYERWINFEK